MSDSTEIMAAMKMATWERAKGELRTLLAMQGAFTPTYDERTGLRADQDRQNHYNDLDLAIREFIAKIEDNGLGE